MNFIVNTNKKKQNRYIKNKQNSNYRKLSVCKKAEKGGRGGTQTSKQENNFNFPT